MSNVKQIVLGLLMYNNDYDERFMGVPWEAFPGWRRAFPAAPAAAPLSGH